MVATELRDAGLQSARAIEGSGKPLSKRRLAQLIDGDPEITPEVALQSTPEHANGHCCVLIASRAARGLITSDMRHHPFQTEMPEVCSRFCWDDRIAAAIWRRILSQCERDRAVVFGSHFVGPRQFELVRTVQAGGW